MAPALLIPVLMYPGIKREDLHTLRYVWCEGTPCRDSTKADFKAMLSPEAGVTQWRGMTETGLGRCILRAEGDDTGSV